MTKTKPNETKPIKRLRHLLTYGNLWIYILSLIKKEKKQYAYALDDAIGKKFLFKPGKIMVYIVLYKLEHEGLIESKFEERRKYYRLTKKGADTLVLAKHYFLQIARKIE